MSRSFRALLALGFGWYCGAPAIAQEWLLAAEQPAIAPIEAEASPSDSESVDFQSLADRITELEKQLEEQTAKQEADPLEMKSSWGKNGWQAESKDKKFRVHVGGRIQMDAVGLDSDDLVLNNGRDDDAVFLRRARFRIDGAMYDTTEWAAEFDFVNNANDDPNNPATPVDAFGGNVIGVPVPTDLWFMWHEVPIVGNVRVGNQKEPLGLEHLTSSRFLDFMERSYLQDAYFGPFNNGFTPGIAISDWNADETATYALGVFKNAQNVFGYDTGDNEYSITGRLSCVPYTACEGAQMMHVGVGASYRGLDQDADPARGNLRLRSRPSLRNGPGPLNPTIADTNFSGRLFADSEVLLAPELAVVNGPWLFQTEYVGAFANSTVFTPNGGAPVNLGQVFTNGAYGEVLYFLTGEHRAYEGKEGRFGRVVPNRNAIFRRNACGLSGPGAWQVGVRYGFLDLRDDALDGGQIQDITIGLNWFLNPFAKWQFNYVHQIVENRIVNNAGQLTANNDGTLDGFGVRFAWDF